METFLNTAYKEKMTDGDFVRLSSFVNEELGIKMPYSKKLMLQGRLQKRLNDLKIRTFKEYIEYVFDGNDSDDEMIKMIDLITTNKTDFFREASHFDYMTRTILPELSSISRGRKNVRIWSAGCSSGEEPYTIAIVLKEFVQKNPDVDYEILGTDISMRILQKAVRAVYDEDRIAQIPWELKRKYFLKSKDPNDKAVRLIPELRVKVSFQRLNFMDPVYTIDKTFDIIFCRNVLIYFSRETQEQVITKLAAKLRPDGYFFLGHSESITNMAVPLQQIKPTIYRKI